LRGVIDVFEVSQSEGLVIKHVSHCFGVYFHPVFAKELKKLTRVESTGAISVEFEEQSLDFLVLCHLLLVHEVFGLDVLLLLGQLAEPGLHSEIFQLL
jgi:hypothetical protein